MPIPILMPALSPTMTEGTLARWLKHEGDPVTPGDVIAEIETDKATMGIESVDEGVLGKILVPDGAEGIAVNTTIGVLLEEGEDTGSLADFKPTAPPAAEPAVQATAAPPSPAATPLAAAPVEKPTAGRLIASPLAKRMAAQAGINLSLLTGSGPNGRIVKADIEAYRAKAPMEAPAAKVPPSTAVPSVEGAYELIPLTTMRRIVARRMVESKQQVPHFYLTIDCEIDDLLDMRRRLNDKADGRYRLSVNDMVIKAAAIALRRVPAANAAWSDDGIKRYKSVDIAVAVALDDGLITPVVRNADAKGLETISTEMKSLAERARAGKLLPEDYQGGTFSLSNLGMYGIKDFGAVINPPQGCILAVGAGEQRPVVKNGALAIATVMSCTLSVDHRSVDGAVGAQYLAAFKQLAEDPLAMLL